MRPWIHGHFFFYWMLCTRPTNGADYRPIPSCTCKTRCSCNLIPTIKSYREGDYVIRFLKRLNEQCAVVRSHIMRMNSLPSIERVFSFLGQQERLFGIVAEETQVLASSSNYNSSTRKWKGKEKFSKFRSNGSKNSYGKGKSSKNFTFYNKAGDVDKNCFKRIWYPSNFKNCNAMNNYITRDEDETDDNKSTISHNEGSS